MPTSLPTSLISFAARRFGYNLVKQDRSASTAVAREVIPDIVKMQNDRLLSRIDAGLSAGSKELLHEVTRCPTIADALLSENMWSRYSDIPMYRMILGAAAFGYGKPGIAALHFGYAARAVSHPMVIHCLARSFAALGNDQAAMDVLKAGMNDFPEDRLLRVEACTALFRMGETAAANELFRPVAQLFVDEQEACRALSEVIKLATAGNLFERQASGDLYDDKFVTDLCWDYNASFTRFNEYQEGSAFMSHLIGKEVAAAIKATDARAVIDFGVMCGFPNYCLAEEFPSVMHYGVDRQTLIKEVNDKYYKRNNIEFEAGDIFAFLGRNRNKLKGSTLFHARTAAVC